MALSTMNMMGMNINHVPAGVNRLAFETIRSHQETAVVMDCPKSNKSKGGTTRLAESLSNLLHLHIDTPPHPRNRNRNQNQNQNQNHLLHDHDHDHTNVKYGRWMAEEKHSTPTSSPKETISHKWHDIHGSKGWENLLDPLHPLLRREIVKYGELAQATYDAFDYDSFSDYCGSCRYNSTKLFEKLGLTKNGYHVTNYIYAMSQIELPRWLERAHSQQHSWSKHSNWMGYVCVSDDLETRRIGRRDIVVAWRGTVSPSEWYEDMQRKLEPIIGFGNNSAEAKVEHGFQSIYTSKSQSTRYNKSSASEQVMREVTRLVQYYQQKGEEVSLTITGHSLGGALALLNAYEAATTLPGLPISVISFGAPRVGNIAFRDELHQMGVRTLRVVVKQDIVHRMPGMFLNESLQKFDDITGTLEWVYTHVGAELKLDVRSSPYLKTSSFNLVGFHSLETYLHLVDGFLSTTTGFRSNARRDIALVNKACDMLVDELRIPHCWYQLSNKGLVCNEHGRWVKPKRDPEDIPSPTTESHDHHIHSLQLIHQSDNVQLQPSYI